MVKNVINVTNYKYELTLFSDSLATNISSFFYIIFNFKFSLEAKALL